MPWFKRLKEDAKQYYPKECPDYGASDYFTIKLYHGGTFTENHNEYVGGDVDFFDMCNVDEISLLEITGMSKECGHIGIMNFWYKLPMDLSLFEIPTDEELMTMCTLLPKSRFVQLYVTTIPPIHWETEPVTLDFNFDYPHSTQYEEEQEQMLRDLEGVPKDPSDCDDDDVPNWGPDDSDDESFHSDQSNKDQSDDDLIYEQTVDKSVQDNVDSEEDEGDRHARANLDENYKSDESSIYAGSDEERIAFNSSDDEEDNFPVFNEDTDMANPTFELGMCFKSSQVFRNAVKKHAIVERRPVMNVKNYGRRVKYVCEAPCKWKVYASPMQKSTTYQIKSLNKVHTCMPTFNQKQINSRWIANHYMNEIRMNPTWPITAFHKKIVNDFKCEVSRHAVYRAKSKALLEINGTHEVQFGEVWNYAHQLLKVMPDSTVKVMVEHPEPGTDRGRFQRLYVCLGPIKRAFINHCRHIVGLDGCHLKGPYGGQMLAAVGVDANDGMYPIAWSVVEAETTESWTWFLQYLCQDIQIRNAAQWTFISDRQKGLINALETVVPMAEHRFCVMHLYQNMNKDHKGVALRQLLWKAARSTTEWEFKKHMQIMEKASKKCYDWLMEKPKSQWSRCAFRTTSSTDMFVNNHCEVFNSSIRKFRDLPLITMFREIHRAVMKRIQVRRDKMLHKDFVICPSAQRKLSQAMLFAGGCVVTWSGGSSYSVTCTDGGHELVVDLLKKQCTCRKWDLTGIPCYHACACIGFRNDSVTLHVSDWYTKDMYMKLYSHTLEPIVGPESWELTPYPKPLAPNVKVQTGRPKKNRSTKNDIPKDATKLTRHNTIVNCTYCKARGHNARTCAAKRSDELRNAAAEGRAPKVGKTTVTCKKCKAKGHNSRTCKAEPVGGKTATTCVQASTHATTSAATSNNKGMGKRELSETTRNGKKRAPWKI